MRVPFLTVWLFWGTTVFCQPPGMGGMGPGSGGCSDCVETPCSGSAYESHPLCTAWLLNTEGTTSAVFESIQVNVQDIVVATSASTGLDYIKVSASGIPDYTFTATAETVTSLNARPRAATDFRSGSTSAVQGTTYNWGSDVGFRNTNCGVGDGQGWWPPGPGCPTDTAKANYFPAHPVPASEVCNTQLGEIGTLINGVSIFDWSDAQSYNGGGVWNNLAAQLEKYDVDLCGGHAANGDYHHHFPTDCAMSRFGDTGTAHSPVVGFAADGFPVHGPYHSSGVKSESCWKPRDYSAGSLTGCGVDGARTCQLVDPYDISQGTTTVAAGPTTSGTVTSLSSNVFAAVSGIYFEDYYFDTACESEGGRFLDRHNGHDHDGLGYHYHMSDTFPYVPGPTFHGALHSTGFVACASYCDTAGTCTTDTDSTPTFTPTSTPTPATPTPTSTPTATPTPTPTPTPVNPPRARFVVRLGGVTADEIQPGSTARTELVQAIANTFDVLVDKVAIDVPEAAKGAVSTTKQTDSVDVTVRVVALSVVEAVDFIETLDANQLKDQINTLWQASGTGVEVTSVSVVASAVEEGDAGNAADEDDNRSAIIAVAIIAPLVGCAVIIGAIALQRRNKRYPTGERRGSGRSSVARPAVPEFSTMLPPLQDETTRPTEEYLANRRTTSARRRDKADSLRRERQLSERSSKEEADANFMV